MFNSKLQCSCVKEQHEIWYNEIRGIVSDRITSEEERMPSHTSMWRHWLRSCWVARMWQNSSEADLFHMVPKPENSGWKLEDDGSYSFDWECPQLQQRIENTITFLIKGCSCKRGCLSLRCGCKKKGSHCGPGCQCQSCKNLPLSDSGEPLRTTDSESDDEEEESNDDESSSDSEESENIQTEVIADNFEDSIIDISLY